MSKKKRTKRLIAILCTVIFLLGLGFGLWKFFQYKQDQKTVEVVPVMQVTDYYWGDNATSYGILSSEMAQEIYPDSSKIVSEIFVEEGQAVQIGDPLFQYDKEELELDVEFKRVAVTKADVDIETAQKQLARLQNTKPAATPGPTTRPTSQPSDPVVIVTPRPTARPTSGPTPTPVPPADVTLYSRLDLTSLPYKGAGTTDDPYVFLCTKDCIVTPEFLQWLLGMGYEPSPTATPTPEPTPEPEEGEEGGETGEETEPGGEETEPTPTPVPTPAPTQKPGLTQLRSPFAAVFEVRDGNSNYGQLISAFKLDGTQLSASFQFTDVFSGYNTLESIAGIFGATPTPVVTATPAPNNYNHMGYNSTELARLIREKKAEIQSLQLARKQAQLDLDVASLQLQNSTVLSTVDGVVRTLTDQETAMMNGSPFLVVAGSDTYYVNGAISENMLGIVEVGHQISVMDYMSGRSYVADIMKINDYPLENGANMYYTGVGNPNSAFYEFTAVIDPSQNPENLRNGYGVEVTFNTQDENAGSTLYLQRAYIREDTAGHYVMKAGVDNRLVKQYVKTGKSIWGGSSLEIRSGLTLDDYVAFPYGTDVKEGVRVVLQGSDNGPMGDDAIGVLPALK